MNSHNDEPIEFSRPFHNDNAEKLIEEGNVLNNFENGSGNNFQSSRIQSGLPPLNFRSNRRGSVSAESYQPLRRCSQIDDNTNTNTKNTTMKHSQNAINAVKNNFLFRSLDPEQLALVFQGMTERLIKSNEIVIKQGEEGDNFYIVEEGIYGVEVDGKEINVQIGPGGSFGELALMYNSPRSATIKALKDGKLYAIDRLTFRRVIIDLAHEKRCKYMDFLKSLPLLATSLSEQEIGKIADALEEVNYSHQGDLIIKQGEPGDSFYIVLQGSARVEKDNEHVGSLNPGDYFGELALLNGQPRAASIYVQEVPFKCLRLGAADFVRLLGPLEELLKRNEEQYNKYKQFI